MEVSAAHHKCTETLWTTLQLLSSLMGSLGGESSGLMGIKIPGWAPMRCFTMWGATNVAAAAGNFHVLSNRKQSAEVGSWSFTPSLQWETPVRWWRTGSSWDWRRERHWMLTAWPQLDLNDIAGYVLEFPWVADKAGREWEWMRVKTRVELVPMSLCGGLTKRVQRSSCEGGLWFEKQFYLITSDSVGSHSLSSQLQQSLSCLCFKKPLAGSLCVSVRVWWPQ